MIPVVRLVKSLRYVLQDMQGMSISDFELIEAINHAAQLLYSRLSEQFVSSALKKKIIVVDNTGSATLPTDFVRVHQVGLGNGEIAIPTTYDATVEGTYRILGDMFYAPAGSYGLEYYYVPVRVVNLGDYLDVPQTMSARIQEIALAIYNHDITRAEQIAQICAKNLGGREVSHIDGQGPVQVLGGKV